MQTLVFNFHNNITEKSNCQIVIYFVIVSLVKIAFFEVTEGEQKLFFKQSLSEHKLVFFDTPLTETTLPEDTAIEVLSVFVNCQVTKKVIESFPKLKLITARATGFDNIDIKTAKEKNILVANVPSYGSHTVAEFTFALILSLSRKIPQATQRLKETGKFSYENLRGMNIFGKTIGVIGTGKIGAHVIKIAKAFEMKVIAVDPFPNKDTADSLNFEYVNLERLLKESDIVTIHSPLTENTHHLINKENIALMKKGSILINTARGGIVETDGLFQAITSGQIAGAALDVLEGEKELKEELQIFKTGENYPQDLKTMLENHILMDLENVIITPHMAFYSKEAEESIMQTTIDNIKSYLSNKPQNLVM